MQQLYYFRTSSSYYLTGPNQHPLKEFMRATSKKIHRIFQKFSKTYIAKTDLSPPIAPPHTIAKFFKQELEIGEMPKSFEQALAIDEIKTQS